MTCYPATANAWLEPTDRGSRFDRVDRGVSEGGASLQACVLVLIFAACVESQRPTCHACGLWHDDATPCETHAPWVGELLERATTMAEEMRDEHGQPFMSAVREFVRSQGVTDEELAAIDVEMVT